MLISKYEATLKKILPYLHPFFFAVYPILELRNYNIRYVDAATLVRPVFFALLFASTTWVTLRVFTREWQKSGVITTLILISFFSYGHVFLQTEIIFGSLIRHRNLILIYTGLLLLAGAFILWRVKNLETIIRVLTVMGAILTVFSIARSMQYDFSVYQSALASRKIQKSLLEDASNSSITTKPDIYLILLDAHTSSRVLDNDFGYDNSTFTQQLEGMGFYVAECAQSNYPQTKLSVTSLFYGNYHQAPTLYPLYSSLVIETLRAQGYQVITFENRSNGHFAFAEDMRFSRNQMLLGKADLTGGLSEFEITLIKTSLARIVLDIPQLIPGLELQSLQKVEFYEHYQQTYFILDELKRLPEMDGPKFVFAHFLVPHPPFIFTPNGDFLWADEPARGYVSNVQFIDSQIAPVVDEIIRKSKIPPIIIIMGDHGPSGVPKLETPQMRMSILNAYYVNERAKRDLYETITPVNSFRIVFNNYFGTEYPLLEDLSYHASKFEDFTPQNVVVNECQTSP